MRVKEYDRIHRESNYAITKRKQRKQHKYKALVKKVLSAIVLISIIAGLVLGMMM